MHSKGFSVPNWNSRVLVILQAPLQYKKCPSHSIIKLIVECVCSLYEFECVRLCDRTDTKGIDQPRRPLKVIVVRTVEVPAIQLRGVIILSLIAFHAWTKPHRTGMPFRKVLASNRTFRLEPLATATRSAPSKLEGAAMIESNKTNHRIEKRKNDVSVKL